MKKMICLITLFLIMISVTSLSACTKEDNVASQLDFNHENMVTEYMATSINIPGNIGMAIRLCVSDEYVYVLGDGSGENIIARYDQNTGNWEGLSGISSEYTPVDISYCDRLWILLQKENGGYSLYNIDNDYVSEIIQLNIPSDVRITGFYAYSEGLLFWNYSQIYLCDPASGSIIREKQLNNTWTLNGISIGSSGIYAQINKNGENGLMKIEDIFSNTNAFLKCDGLSALVPLCINSNETCLIGEIESVMSYDISSGTYNKLFSWADIGCLMPDLVPAVIESTDETIFILDRYTGNLIEITPQLVPERTVITLATSINNSLLNHIVYEFNQSNSLYKIEVEMYSANDVDRLRTEIIAGNGPDIIDTFSLPLAGEINGYYEDLLPYIENDQEISESDFLPSIFEASKINGALYYIMPSFDLHTVVTLGSIQNTNYSFDEYRLQFADIADCEIDINMKAEEILQSAFPIIQSDIIVSSDNGKTVDIQRFKQWLNFCTEATSFDISFETISNCRRTSALSKNLGGEISFIGLPGQTNCGSYATPSNMCFAMLSTGINKDAAWNFMRQFLLPVYQDNIAPFGFPIISQSLNTVIQESLDDEDLDFTERDAEKLRELLNSIDVVSFFDNTLKDMVALDANAYFSGQYSLDDIVALLEPKIKIYLAERS